MLARQRQRMILSMLETQPSLRTIELARKFDVTDETIRRDLEFLDSENKLIRTHGGALRIEKRIHDIPMLSRLKENRDQKHEIARKALEYIKEGETILMDLGSTSLALAEILPNIKLTVITNGHDTIAPLMDKDNITVISTGGILNRRSHSFVGAVANASLRRFPIDKMFFSYNGLDLDRGASEAIELHAEFKESVFPLCTCKILLCDSSKFGVRSARFFADLGVCDIIITDSSADPSFIEKLSAAGVVVK